MMQGDIFKHWNILAAALFSVVLIGGAYELVKSADLSPVAQASTETAMLKAIASKDSDADGLPDWEESLYGTDAHVVDTFHLGMTDGEAVAKGLIVPKTSAAASAATPAALGSTIVDSSLPAAPGDNTLTSAFSKSFFTLYVAAKQENGGKDLSSDQTATLATEALNQLAGGVAPAADFKKQADIKVSGSGPEALRAFAIAAEAILKKNVTDAKMSEIGYFQAAIEGSDATATAHLASLAKAYRSTAIGLSVLPVPAEIAGDDLALVNAIMRLAEIDEDFARVNDDPLTAMLALQQYKPTELAAEQALINIAKTYVANGVVIKNGAPGAAFVNIMPNLGAAQAAAKKK